MTSLEEYLCVNLRLELANLRMSLSQIADEEDLSPLTRGHLLRVGSAIERIEAGAQVQFDALIGRPRKSGLEKVQLETILEEFLQQDLAVAV